MNGFLNRNNTLSVREPEMTSICRAVGFNKVQVDKFFGIWRALLEDLGEIDGSRLWNMDESGLTAVHKPGRIIAKKGQKQVGKITSGERQKTVTVLGSINAHGRHSPPFMIFPRKNMNDHLLLGNTPGTVGVPTDSGWTDSGWTDSDWTDNGWTDSTVFIKWLKHFVDHVKPTPSKKDLLFVDQPQEL